MHLDLNTHGVCEAYRWHLVMDEGQGLFEQSNHADLPYTILAPVDTDVLHMQVLSNLLADCVHGLAALRAFTSLQAPAI